MIVASTVPITQHVETMVDNAANALQPILLYIVAAAVGFALLSFAVRAILRMIHNPGSSPLPEGYGRKENSQRDAEYNLERFKKANGL